MKIQQLKVNHIENPIGFSMEYQFLQWNITEIKYHSVKGMRVIIALESHMKNIVYDSHWMKYQGSILLKNKLLPKTRYFWQVMIQDEDGMEIESEIAFFETAKEEKKWIAQWIAAELEEDGIVYTTFHIKGAVHQARLYISGLGLYEAYLNTQKIGNEYFAPGFNNYDKWIQFQTYEIDEKDFYEGENKIEIFLGSGWYKGRYMSMGPEIEKERYGNNPRVLGELHIEYKDGTTEIIKTDLDWKAKKSKIRENSLYDGEVYDESFEDETVYPVSMVAEKYDKLKARYSIPVKNMETKRPQKIIITPKNEVVLDFGQNMVGWVSFLNHLPKGKQCGYEAGEILQEGCFYRENLRSAKAEFSYISNGDSKWIQPHFTYYGFRYIKLNGFEMPINLDDFQGHVLYSDMEVTGNIETGNKKVNQLISNILWGQKGNFLDVPTDCPQRDERFGWTGDAQIFSMTAAFNMNVAAFFRKYMYDVYSEQQQSDGLVPFIVPNICFGNKTSAAWGDVATIVPWNLYLMYGNKGMLEEQYLGMKAWTNYIWKQDKKSGNSRLWTSNAHFGDWLALDDPGNGQPTGGTDMSLIASAYYYLSVLLTQKAATVLEKSEDIAIYEQLRLEIKEAFQKEYLTPNGRLAVDTQTAYVLVLYAELFREDQQQRLIDGLVEKLKKNMYKLETGFVGTPYLCMMLSKYGRNDLAYKLLLNEDYPGWLYCVNLGATTIWERWNSVLPNGAMNPKGMNSLNHYSYGAIQEWMYRYILGINPRENEPGFVAFSLTPMPDKSLGWAKGSFNSNMGLIVSEWSYEENGKIHYHFEVPYGSQGYVKLKSGQEAILTNGSYDFYEEDMESEKKGYTSETDIQILLADEEAKKLILQFAPELVFMPKEMVCGSLESAMVHVFSEHSYLELKELEEKLKEL